MADRIEFKEKLEDILTKAIGQGRKITVDEVKEFFKEDQLSKEQIGLVCGYLLSQKIAVSGYVQPQELQGDAQEEAAAELSAEEKAYIEEYVKGFAQMNPTTEKEKKLAMYLPKVVEEAKKLHNPDFFIGDMIQEGNISLLVALETLEDEAQILEEVRAGMLAAVEEQTETKRRDKKMVEKVSELDRVLEEMSEELGRKVAVDELAMQLGISEEQVADILKLAGEETEDEE